MIVLFIVSFYKFHRILLLRRGINTEFICLTCCLLFSIYPLHCSRLKSEWLLSLYTRIHLLNFWEEFFFGYGKFVYSLCTAFTIHARSLYVFQYCIQSCRSGKASSSLMEQQLDLVCALLLKVKVVPLEVRLWF